MVESVTGKTNKSFKEQNVIQGQNFSACILANTDFNIKGLCNAANTIPQCNVPQRCNVTHMHVLAVRSFSQRTILYFRFAGELMKFEEI